MNIIYSIIIIAVAIYLCNKLSNWFKELLLNKFPKLRGNNNK